MTSQTPSVTLDGVSLTLDQVASVCRPDAAGRFATVQFDDGARGRLEKARSYIEANWLTDDAPLMYSFNTGVGLFKDVRVPVADMALFQEKLILAHATGIGEPFAEDVVRATMLLRANAFASNFSGAAPALVDRLLSFLNAGLHPVIPQKGSVGASGDLAPLAHLSGALCGMAEAEIFYQGARMSAVDAIAAAGLPADLPLGPKDASALINGSTVSLALSALATWDARRVLKAADIALAMSLEAMRGEKAAFDPRIHAARPHPGQAKTARNILRLVDGSSRMSQAARDVVFPEEARSADTPAPPRVQDVYSLRCAPQVHGPVEQALQYIEGIVETELNSATDNPLMFANDDDTYTVISGGHFHGQYLAQAADLLSIALADLGAISERRLARLIDPGMSYGLPRNLNAGQKGLNTGFATVQCSMSALVMENRGLATPGSVDTIPGKGNAEDHVANSTWCGRKALTIVQNAEQIVAVEMLIAAQALSMADAMVDGLAADFPLGKGTAAAVKAIRAAFPPALDGDRWFATEMNTMLVMVRNGKIADAVESVVGTLE